MVFVEWLLVILLPRKEQKMRGLFSVAVLRFVAAGLMLAMPSASQAQSCDYGGYGRSYGGTGFPGYSGYGASSGYYYRGYATAALSCGGYSGSA